MAHHKNTHKIKLKVPKPLKKKKKKKCVQRLVLFQHCVQVLIKAKQTKKDPVFFFLAVVL